MADTPFHLFGIRHHGPGCARSLLRALEALQPDCILVEGPPDGEAALPLLTAPGMTPPVALLIYNPENASEAVFYPFATFSPEWNALQYGLARAIPTRFMDLPVAHQFALRQTDQEAVPETGLPVHTEADAEGTEGQTYADPLDWLGRAAGYEDGESWWNHMVEERGDSLELFAAIREAMSSVRREAPPRRLSAAEARREDLREAHMRRCMRQAQKEGFSRIAVICGAWHVPALAELPTAKADNDLLKGLPKTRVEATWVPWSYRNLSYASGYGAGVRAPGWYEHLWQTAEGSRGIQWLARAAALFREEGLDCSSAHIIEASRLADTLAALHERPQAGLEELFEALRSVVCMGEDAPLRLIEQHLIVGERLGSTPENAPAVPLARDLAAQQKSLRLKPEALRKTLDLDLRQANDLARSHLLHRLVLLDIDWGRLSRTGRSAKGSFHEIWELQWEPELALKVIEASRWGNSVAEAATALTVDKARNAQALAVLSELVDKVLLADLSAAMEAVTQALDSMAAVTSDVSQILAAIPALAKVARYGNVRQTDTALVEHLLQTLVPRAAIGLPGACSALDDDAAGQMRDTITTAHQALRLLQADAIEDVWHAALTQLAQSPHCHSLLGGLASRLLFDAQHAALDETALRMSLALSTGNDPAPAAAWLEGFLNKSGMVLLHDNQLWSLVDDWLSKLSAEHFGRELPLLRRAFSAFTPPERRQLGERAQSPATPARAAAGSDWDARRATLPVPLLHQLLGIPT
jgi:hypothetical protein